MSEFDISTSSLTRHNTLYIVGDVILYRDVYLNYRTKTIRQNNRKQ